MEKNTYYCESHYDPVEGIWSEIYINQEGHDEPLVYPVYGAIMAAIIKDLLNKLGYKQIKKEE